MDGNADEPRNLLVYNLGKDPLQATELKEFYMQEYRAIKKLRTTGLVPEVQDPSIWSEDYLIVTITPPAGKSLKATALPETHDDFVVELQIAAACFKGLDLIHSQNVLHRALGPETIYVQSKQPPKVMFTNFYAARMGTNTIAPLWIFFHLKTHMHLLMLPLAMNMPQNRQIHLALRLSSWNASLALRSQSFVRL